jgi:hypothetical protein
MPFGDDSLNPIHSNSHHSSDVFICEVISKIIQIYSDGSCIGCVQNVQNLGIPRINSFPRWKCAAVLYYWPVKARLAQTVFGQNPEKSSATIGSNTLKPKKQRNKQLIGGKHPIIYRVSSPSFWWLIGYPNHPLFQVVSNNLKTTS